MSKQEKIHKILIEGGKTLALAESCSGGHLSAMFVSLSDASQYLLGGIIAYSNEVKKNILHVSPKTILSSGAASREVADEMWIGLMKIIGADYGIAITGIAGPKGGTREKPVGTVFIAVGEKGKKPHVKEYHFKGDRNAIIQNACEMALEELILLL